MVESTSLFNFSISWFRQRLQESGNPASPWTVLSSNKEEKFFPCLRVCISYLYGAPSCGVQKRRSQGTRRVGRATGIWPRNDLVTWCVCCSWWDNASRLITSWNWPSFFLPVLRAKMWWKFFFFFFIFKYQLVLNAVRLCHTFYCGSTIFRKMGFTPSESQQKFNCGAQEWRLNPDFIVSAACWCHKTCLQILNYLICA